MLRPTSVAALAILTAVTMFQPLSTDMYLPAMPQMTRFFATDAAGLQLTLTVFFIAFAFAQLVYGPLSDRFGRRPVLIGGVTVFLLASAACSLAQSLEALIAARFAQAFGACTGTVMLRAFVRDVFDRAHAARTMAYIGMATALAPLIAPVLGGYLAVGLGWQWIFYVLTGLGALVLLAVATQLPETNAHKDPAALDPIRLITAYLALFRSPAYLGYLLAIGFGFSGLFAFIVGSPFVVIEFLGVAPENFGYFFAIGVLGFIAGAMIAGRITLRLGIDRMVLLGTAIAMTGGLLLAGLALAGFANLAAIVAPMALYTFGHGILLPNAGAGAVSVFPRTAGVASAMIGFAQMMISAAASLLVGQFDDGTQVPMVVVVALCGAGAFLGYFLLTWPRREGT